MRLPVIQAPMAGGIVTSEMIYAVSKSGGLGSLPLGYLNISEAQNAIRKTKSLGNYPFAVNVFIPSPEITIDKAKLEKMIAHVNYYREKLSLPLQETISPLTEESAEEQIDMAVSEGVRIISFTFGMLTQQKILELR
jgi:nitronate monooxygenase